MKYDFTMCLPVERQLRQHLLDLFLESPTRPVRMIVLGRPALVYKLEAEDYTTLTVTGHFEPLPSDRDTDLVALPAPN